MSNEVISSVSRGRARLSTKKTTLSKKDQFCRKVIEYGILAVIVFSPLPAASVYEWSILIIQLLVFVMLVAFLLMGKKPRINENLTNTLKIPKFLFIGLFLFIIFQILYLPKSIVKLLSPGTYGFHEFFSIDFANASFLSISLIPSQTFRQGLELLTYFFLGFIIVMNITKKRQIMRIFYVLIGMGIFQAFYGMFELYNKNPRILFFKKIYSLNSVTGTFINRNHFSGYLEMIVPLAVGLIIARIDIISLMGLKWREKLLRLSEKGWAINLMIVFGILGMSLAIVFSQSRSGVFILLFTFVLFFCLVGIYFRDSVYQRRSIGNFLRISLLTLIGISLFLGIGSTVERFSLDSVLYESRPVIWTNTIEIYADYPIFGTGLGTYPSIYPQFESDGTLWHVFHAHNDYLEYLSELGIIGFGLLFGGIFVVLLSSFLVWRYRRHTEAKGLALGAIVSVICILIHSFTDFNLQIPANMLLFSVLLSLALVTSFFRYKKPVQKEKKEPLELQLKDIRNER
jgi:O-antigen ligase